MIFVRVSEMQLLLGVGYNTVNFISWFSPSVDILVSFVAGEWEITLLRPWHQTSASRHPVRKVRHP